MPMTEKDLGFPLWITVVFSPGSQTRFPTETPGSVPHQVLQEVAVRQHL